MTATVISLDEKRQTAAEDCEACGALEDLCEYHAGFMDGWDYCAAFVKRTVDNGDG